MADAKVRRSCIWLFDVEAILTRWRCVDALFRSVLERARICLDVVLEIVSGFLHPIFVMS